MRFRRSGEENKSDAKPICFPPERETEAAHPAGCTPAAPANRLVSTEQDDPRRLLWAATAGGEGGQCPSHPVKEMQLSGEDLTRDHRAISLNGAVRFTHSALQAQLAGSRQADAARHPRIGSRVGPSGRPRHTARRAPPPPRARASLRAPRGAELCLWSPLQTGT